jgi:hypothetical protein
METSTARSRTIQEDSGSFQNTLVDHHSQEGNSARRPVHIYVDSRLEMTGASDCPEVPQQRRKLTSTLHVPQPTSSSSTDSSNSRLVSASGNNNQEFPWPDRNNVSSLLGQDDMQSSRREEEGSQLVNFTSTNKSYLGFLHPSSIVTARSKNTKDMLERCPVETGAVSGVTDSHTVRLICRPGGNTASPSGPTEASCDSGKGGNENIQKDRILGFVNRLEALAGRSGRSDASLEVSRDGIGNIQEFPRPEGNLVSSLHVPFEALPKRLSPTRTSLNDNTADSAVIQEFPRPEGNVISSFQARSDSAAKRTAQPDASLEKSTADGNSIQEFPRPDGDVHSTLQATYPDTENKTRVTGSSFHSGIAGSSKFPVLEGPDGHNFSSDIPGGGKREKVISFQGSVSSVDNLQSSGPGGNLISSLQVPTEKLTGQPLYYICYPNFFELQANTYSARYFS